MTERELITKLRDALASIRKCAWQDSPTLQRTACRVSLETIGQWDGALGAADAYLDRPVEPPERDEQMVMVFLRLMCLRPMHEAHVQNDRVYQAKAAYEATECIIRRHAPDFPNGSYLSELASHLATTDAKNDPDMNGIKRPIALPAK